MIDYPQYPLPRTNVLRKGEYPKAPLGEIMQVYDEFTALGLYLVPKRRKQKIPVFKFWEKQDGKLINILSSRGEALDWQKRNDVSGWCIVAGELSERLVVLDFDTQEIQNNGVDPVNLYNYIQSMSPTSFVLNSPANGAHLYYRLADHQAMIGNNKPPVMGMDIRGEGGQVVTLTGYNRYDNDYEKGDMLADKKGVPDGHCETYAKLPFGEYHTIPTMSDELYEWVTSVNKTINTDEQIAENYGLTEVGMKRIEAHFNQSLDERERLTIECLSFVLEQWTDDKTYEQWLQMWMSAHHGSTGSTKVRDYILTHPAIYWRDGDNGKLHFKQAWDKHEQRESGYTIASLFWLAKRTGWLTRTGYEIPDDLCEVIDYVRVSDWIDTLEQIPNRCLLMSQTGTGKTYAIRKLWDNLGQPKTVIFVPSIKLATELASTLRTEHKMDATLYRDNDTGLTRSVDELIEAQILVTTLQTFANKVNNPMSEYGLVILEEADQLLQQFSRGGGGLYGSHVSEREARNGFRVIREAMSDSGAVWFLDATMTQISYHVAEATRDTHTVRVIRNAHRNEKSLVKFVSDKGSAYQAVLRGLEQNKRVVVVADTAHVAQEVMNTMQMLGALYNKKYLLIVRDTERDPKVLHFMEDVNVGAAEYDFIAYNSVMASGVSITAVKPDLIVQICTYLSPRTNLQMLNRYRKQSEVVCYYRTGENLYARRANEVLEFAQQRTILESQMVNIPLATRTSDAELRAHVAALSISDNEIQDRSPREFYQALLHEDGRKIEYVDGEPVSAVVKHTIKSVQELRREMKKHIAETWQNVQPIDRDRPAPDGFTTMQIILGETHAEIERVLRGNIPIGVAPEIIHARVQEFKRFGFILTAFVKQEMALRSTEAFMADKGRAITTLMNNITIMRVVSILHKLYHTLDEILTDDTLENRAMDFVQTLVENKDAYNAIITRRAQKFDEVWKRSEDIKDKAIDFAKILLARIGLKQRAERSHRSGDKTYYAYYITNLSEAREFLAWRNADDLAFNPDLVLHTEPIDGIIGGRSETYTMFYAMPIEKQEQVLAMLEQDGFDIAMQVVNAEISY